MTWHSWFGPLDGLYSTPEAVQERRNIPIPEGDN